MSGEDRPRHFVIAGAQRCGSTLLYRMLARHPEITMATPERPEPKYFLRMDAVELGLAGYERHFPADSRTPVRGEKSTSYIESEAAARRMREVLPRAKVVFVLRDPVERAISNYRFSVQHGAETAVMAEAFLREDERRDLYDRSRYSVSPFAYIQRGLYAEHLDCYRRHFPRERMHVVLFERLISEPAELQRLLRFLDVSADLDLEPSDRPVNASLRPAGSEPSESLRRYLEGVFAVPSRDLANRYGLDLACWSSVAATSPDGVETHSS